MSRRKTTEEFIKEAKQIHGDKYDYSLVEYINAKTKVKIICPKHGLFEQTPDGHLRGNGCKLCGNEKISKNFLKTQKQFIKESKQIHGDKYDYSKVNYINDKTKIEIICPIHGSFWQIPRNHLSGFGCNKCGYDTMAKKRAITTEEFIYRSKQIHGDKYDYSKVNYINAKTKIEIICPVHGNFWQKAYHHLEGFGCNECGNDVNRKTTEQFIKDAKKIHEDKYNYSLVNYVNSYTKIKIICPIHGEFEQNPNIHLQGHGCKKCADDVIRKTTEQFIKDAKKIHGDKYNYSLVEYVNDETPVRIVCKEHGIFEQIPNTHLNGGKCPSCHTSRGEEKIIQELEKYNITYIKEKRFEECRDKNSLPFDFYLPEYNMLIEFDGQQHFEPVNIFGGEKYLTKIKLHDKIKNEFAKENDIKLIRIPYWKINKIGEVIEENIING